MVWKICFKKNNEFNRKSKQNFLYHYNLKYVWFPFKILQFELKIKNLCLVVNLKMQKCIMSSKYLKINYKNKENDHLLFSKISYFKDRLQKSFLNKYTKQVLIVFCFFLNF